MKGGLSQCQYGPPMGILPLWASFTTRSRKLHVPRQLIHLPSALKGLIKRQFIHVIQPAAAGGHALG